MSDPFGGDEPLPIDEVMGVQLPPVETPEDHLEAGKHFAFGGEVAKNFEEFVVSRQIPGYREMRYRVLHIARYLLRDKSALVDLGTSQGRMIRDLIASFARSDDPFEPDERLFDTEFYGVDSEADMLDEAQALIDETVREMQGMHPDRSNEITGDVKLLHHDLQYGLPPEIVTLETPVSVITSVLTVMFVPMATRQQLLQAIYDRLEPGGAFILVEKCLGGNAFMDDLFRDIYYDDKRRNGMTENAISNKRASISNFLVPLKPEWNIDALCSAGFSRQNIEIFWKNLQFTGFLAIK